MAVLSLIAALGYAVLRRGCFLRGITLRIAGRSVLYAAAAPVLLMIFLGLIVPLRIDDSESGGAVLLWAYVLSATWIIALGLVARRIGGATESVRVPRTGWIWPLTAIAAVFAAVAATVVARHPLPAAAVAAAIALVAGILVWSALVVIGWIRRRTPADRAYRARTAKAFAVLVMLAAATSFALALASMPLTRHLEQAFFQQSADEQQNEVTRYLGEKWPEQYKPLPPEVFRLEGTAERVPTTRRGERGG